MLLDLHNNMKLVFELIKEKEEKKSFISSVQALTLNKDKPLSGLAGKYGLYMSDEWWENIRSGKIKTKVIKGIITRLYDAGQDNSGQVNSFELKLSNGSKWDESIYVSNDKDMELFEVGKQVYIYYVFDEMKKQPDPQGNIYYSNIVVEMAVSHEPVKEGVISKLQKIFKLS